MQKLKMHSPDMTQEHIARIRELFPNCVTEARGKDGSLRLSVDFDLLRQELSDSIVEGPQERYHLDWPGKRKAMLAANAPIAKALRPCREESVDFDTTKNLFIEGDNLDALKLLQETYLGKVKMIYIDPPYNTGNDFIYNDDFAETSEAYLSRSNQKDEAGNRLVANPDSKGRFHSAWLSMMYPRLKIARNLLSDEGAILISCNDCELENILEILNDIFGRSNRIACFVVIKAEGGGMAKQVVFGHDYLIVVAKDKNKFTPLSKAKDIRGKIISKDGKLFWIQEDWLRKEFGKYGNCYYEEVEKYKGIDKKNEIDNGIKSGEYVLIKKENGLHIVGKLKSVEEDSSKFYSIVKHLNSKGFEDIASIGMKNIFDYPKPISLISSFVSGVTFFSKNAQDIILDFFAGSSTTAHAVMQLNAEDGGNRQFIMVQLPEACDAKSEAAKAGYGTIAEISKERIRRAGKKILEGDCHEGWNRDVGFRVLKVDTSNMADVFYTPDALQQNLLDLTTDNIKPGRTPEDLLFQVLLDWGVELTLPIRKESIQGKTVFFVDDNALVACFDRGIDEALVRELAACAPLRVVFRDNGFVSDAVKINVEQIFRQLSPGTEVRCL